MLCDVGPICGRGEGRARALRRAERARRRDITGRCRGVEWGMINEHSTCRVCGEEIWRTGELRWLHAGEYGGEGRDHRARPVPPGVLGIRDEAPVIRLVAGYWKCRTCTRSGITVEPVSAGVLQDTYSIKCHSLLCSAVARFTPLPGILRVTNERIYHANACPKHA